MTTLIPFAGDSYEFTHDLWEIRQIIRYRDSCDSGGERLTISRLHPRVLDLFHKKLRRTLPKNEPTQRRLE